MDWPETTIENWPQLQESIDPISVQCVFRGQGNCEWNLVPSFRRLIQNVAEKTALTLERNAILQFRSEAHLYLKPSVLPPEAFKLDAMDTYVEWLMLMQHHGAPTRLLDWTYSPYVAIYFAVIDHWETDAALWYYKGQRVSEVFLNRHKRKPTDYFDFAKLPANELQVTDGDAILYSAIKKMRTAREVAQQGVFTFTNRLMCHQQEVIAETCKGHEFGRILIPKHLKQEFAMRLRLMNVTASALFPGVEGTCDMIRNGLRLDAAYRSNDNAT